LSYTNHSQRVAILGGAGYIGAHLAHALTQLNLGIHIYDDLSTGHYTTISSLPFTKGNILNHQQLVDFLRDGQFDTVIHLAAKSIVSESAEHSTLYHAVNTAGTETVIDAMITAGVTKLIFSSSAAVYGEPTRLPIDETHSVKPINVYGETKLQAERLISSATQRGSIDAITFRYFNAAGAEPSFRTPERHNPETHLIPSLLNSIKLGNSSATIYGSNYSTPDGTAVRDYVHVMDIADAHAKALDFLSHNNGLYTLNLGTTTGSSVLEVVAAIEATLGTTLARRYEDPRIGDPPRLVATSHAAAATINWLPKRSSLRQIILDAWRSMEHYRAD